MNPIALFAHCVAYLLAADWRRDPDDDKLWVFAEQDDPLYYTGPLHMALAVQFGRDGVPT